MKKLLALSLLLLLISCEQIQSDHDKYEPVYNAWMKNHPGSELSYDEWWALYTHALLPEQRPSL